MRLSKTRSRSSGLLLASVSLIAAAAPSVVYAQVDDPQATDGEQTDDVAEEPREEIVVTGSRIRRDRLDAPTPTVAVNSEIIEAKGITNIIDILNELPQVSTGLSNANTSFSFGNIGLSQADLRNLGVRRTLTLVNGRRRAGTPDDSNFLAFDLSSIPAALIERVEVQTGGTSAVYGADAVAGVINLVLKNDFDGLEVYANYGITERGDYHTSAVGATFGTNFEGGNAVLHVSRSDNGLLRRVDRGLDDRYSFVSNPANGSGLAGRTDGIPARIPVRDLKFAYFGIPTITAFLPYGPGRTNIDTIYDTALGNFRPLNAGPRGVIDGSFSQGEGGTTPYDTLVAPTERVSIYGRAKYDLNPKLNVFSEVIFADINAQDRIGAVFDSFSTRISIENPFIPDAVRQQLVAANRTGFTYARQHDEFGRRGTDINRKYYSIAGGLEGKIGSTWDWSAVAEYGKSTTTNRNLNDRLDGRWAEASDAVRDPSTGRIVCRSVEARARGCVPVNVFGVGTISQAAVDYISADHTTTTDTNQTMVQGLISGDLIQLLPAGPIRFSAGAEYRKDELDFRPSFVWEKGLGFFASQFSPVRESNDVKEAFAEVLFPILKDRPFFSQLDVEGAYRVSNYQRAGTVDSWKLGGVYAPIKDIRFRVTRAKAVRAPSLGELFNPGSRGASGLSDPCDPNLLGSGSASRRANCATLGLDPVSYSPNTRRVTTLVFSTGNPDLDVEKADTFTAGVVLQPRFIPGLAVSADYYKIELDGGISRVGAQQTLDSCVDLPTLDNQFCDLVRRGSDGNIQEVRDTYINVAKFRVEGVDVELSYNTRLNDLFGGERNLGSLSVRAIGSYLKNNVFVDRDLISGEETSFENAGEADNPQYRFTGTATYKNGPFQANFSSRFVSSTVTNNDLENPQEDVGAFYNIPSIWYHDLSFAIDLKRNYRFNLGVRNLFDTKPRDHPSTARGNLAYDDLIGRYFFAGVRVRVGGN